ncbi:MAG: sulfotransferase [Gammaproteobacteria bacterium]
MVESHHPNTVSRSAERARLNIEAPIVIIGAGGSGSSLLSQMLDAHPDVTMLGETYFLLPKAWYGFWQADANTILRNMGERLRIDPELETRVTSSAEDYDRFLKLLMLEEQTRTGTVLRNTINAWFCVDTLPSASWGFKDIWNGGFERHDWKIYDYVFPQAQWVHIIRHPLRHLHSAARLSGKTLTTETAVELANHWLGAIDMNKQRASTGRYYEIKYEEIASTPHQTLRLLLGRLGIAWHDNCLLPITQQWGARSKRGPLSKEILERLAHLPGLIPTMTKLGYEWDLPEVVRQSVTSPRLETIGQKSWRLCGPFVPEHGLCWEFNMSKDIAGSEIVGIADDIGQWRRSPLRLFEDGRPLGPAHSLHCWIRDPGTGRYSHWQERLLFTASDNSNPNTNGREYTFDLAG